MSNGMHRFHIALALAATGLGGAFQAALETATARNAEMQRLGVPLITVSGERSSPAATRTSNLAKLRDLSFLRGGARRHHFKGVPMSVAEGKRRARKARNRARHKAHVTKARRRA